jgi:hypothetical protein
MKTLRLLFSTLCILVITGCTSTGTGVTEEQQALADQLGITVEEMNALSDEELQQRMTEISAAEGES